MKKLFLIIAAVLFSAPPALAVPTCGHYMPFGCSDYGPGLTEMMAVTPLQYDDGDAYFSSGFDEDDFDSLGIYDAIAYDGSTPDVVIAGNPNPWTVKSIQQLKGIVDGKFDQPTGTTSQYIRGDGSLATFPLSTRTFNYATGRALNSCFRVSSTKDADVNYSVNISALITLGGGTAALTSYTDSGCTTGSQVLANGAVSSVALLGSSSIPLHAIVPSAKYVKVTATASGGGSAAIDTVQAETLLP